MNELLIPLLIVTISHIALMLIVTRLQNKNQQLRETNLKMRRRMHKLEDDLRFFTGLGRR